MFRKKEIRGGWQTEEEYGQASSKKKERLKEQAPEYFKIGGADRSSEGGKFPGKCLYCRFVKGSRGDASRYLDYFEQTIREQSDKYFLCQVVEKSEKEHLVVVTREIVGFGSGSDNDLRDFARVMIDLLREVNLSIWANEKPGIWNGG